MKQLFLYFSHKLTQEQIVDAKKSLEIEEFIYLPENLQKLWSNVPPELKYLNSYIAPLKDFLKQYANKGDYVLVQGDFGVSCQIINFAKSLELVPIYSTTKRNVTEKLVNGKVVKVSQYQHIIFRNY